MSSHNNTDLSTGPHDDSGVSSAYPGRTLSHKGLAGVERRMRQRGHTVDEPILRDAARQVVGGPVNGKVFTTVRTCNHCGGQYTPTSAPQKFCSHACRRQAAKRDGRRSA